MELPAKERIDPELAGPFAVGRYAAEFRDFLRGRTRVLVIGEVTGLRRARTGAYFELRDADGAVPCAIWNSDLDRLDLPEGSLADGVEVVVGGGPDFYPGSATSSPSFSFRATHIRPAGEGDLLAKLAVLRRRLADDGLFETQKLLRRPLLPKVVGAVTAAGSAARADLLAGLGRRGWHGTIVWADAPVQDRRAAPRITAALRNLAELPMVEIAVVCRGGGSLADLWAFCDEGLCRTVAMLRIPVISAVGHESDTTLIDDVAAVSCSTPTHAADELVRVDVPRAHAELQRQAARALGAEHEAVRSRGRALAGFAAAPQRAVRAERRRLHQLLREARASATRGVTARDGLAHRHALVARRKADAATDPAAASSKLTAIEAAVRGNEPERTLERGYALVESRVGEAITTAQGARAEGSLAIRFADDAVRARVEDEPGE